MMRTTPLAATPLVVLLSCLVGCDDGTPAGPDGFQTIQFAQFVTISGDSAPFIINPDPVRVPPGAIIQWVHATADSFRIDLSQVPADSNSLFGVGITGISGISLVAPADTYKYAVTATIGGRTTTDDPRIIVEPE